VPLLINDRVDVALAVGAEGVHLGQDDMSTFPATPAVSIPISRFEPLTSNTRICGG
jgi:hypothetical protein